MEYYTARKNIRKFAHFFYRDRKEGFMINKIIQREKDLKT